MRVLVTGATGFIGSNLVKYLSGLGNYDVFVLVKPNSNLEVLREVKDKIQLIEVITSFESINYAIIQAKPDVVIHLAALVLTSHEPNQIEQLISSNILFGTLLLEAMVQNSALRIVNTGTFWEYMDGTDEYRPLNLYAASKRAYEDILRYYEDAHNLIAVTLKLYGTYGPNDPRSKIFSLFKKSLTEKEPIPFSPGEQIIDHVYIDDAVTAFEKATQYVYKKEDCKQEAVSIGSGVGFSLQQISRIYEECSGKPLNIKWGGAPYRTREVMCGQADITAAKINFQWEPKFNLKKGISKMLEVEKLHSHT